MKLIIAGGREFQDYDLLKATVLNYLTQHMEGSTEIVCGKARGADQLGERFALENNIPVVYFPADWDVYGKSAGFRRNEQMACYATSLIAFWDGKSHGTKHMIDAALRKGLDVVVVKY